MVLRLKNNSYSLLLHIIIDIIESQRVSWLGYIVVRETGPGEDSWWTPLAFCSRLLFGVGRVVEIVEEFDEDVTTGAKRQQRVGEMMVFGRRRTLEDRM